MLIINNFNSLLFRVLLHKIAYKMSNLLEKNRYNLSLDDLQIAHLLISPHIHKTPVLSSEALNLLAGAKLYFKCENFQKIGAFKARGACNAVMSLSEKEASKGIVTHSSGNHGQAVAYAAALRGVPAYIVMPHNTNKAKVDGVKAYNGQVLFCEPSLKAREELAEKTIIETGAHFVHPYNDLRVIAGQSTATIELLQEHVNLDILLAPTGGGGLLSGTALAAHYLSPLTRVIGTEPEGADDAAKSFHAKELLPQLNPKTIADGLRGALGNITFSLINKYVENIVTVSEADIAASMFLIWQRLKIIVEPSCAVPLAAILSKKIAVEPNQKIGIILSGGNVDFSQIAYYEELAKKSKLY